MSHKKIVTKYTYLSDGELFSATETTSLASTGEVISTKDIFFSTNGENVISSSCDGVVNYDVYNDDGAFLYRTRYSEVCSTDYESTQTNELADGGKEVICTKKLSNGETFTDVITYDQSGEMVKFTHNYRRNDSEIEQQKGSICEYENGNMVRYYQIAPALSKNPLLRAECRYDDNGCCIERKIYVGTYVLKENGKTMVLPPKYGLVNPQEAAASVTSFNYMPLEDYLEQKQSGSGYETGANSNTGANNGGTTTNGYPCEWCKQSGKLDCSVCDGTGKIFSRFDSNGNKVMKTCTYYKCHNGKIECYHCGGDGIYLN
ncbi:MAG: hypothetical protein IKM27_07620 [Clostridia bacterium]|nr:hypothetical protein [Clostridia bacterium]